jgi:hypothetical protein
MQAMVMDLVGTASVGILGFAYALVSICLIVLVITYYCVVALAHSLQWLAKAAYVALAPSLKWLAKTAYVAPSRCMCALTPLWAWLIDKDLLRRMELDYSTKKRCIDVVAVLVIIAGTICFKFVAPGLTDRMAKIHESFHVRAMETRYQLEAANTTNTYMAQIQAYKQKAENTTNTHMAQIQAFEQNNSTQMVVYEQKYLEHSGEMAAQKTECEKQSLKDNSTITDQKTTIVTLKKEKEEATKNAERHFQDNLVLKGQVFTLTEKVKESVTIPATRWRDGTNSNPQTNRWSNETNCNPQRDDMSLTDAVLGSFSIFGIVTGILAHRTIFRNTRPSYS